MMQMRTGALTLLMAGLCAAAEVSGPLHTIRTSGEAIVTVSPDRAEITLGITTSASTAEAAGAQNAHITQQVLQAVRPIIDGKGESKTAGYSLNPDYEYSPNGGKPKLTGYQAVNSVDVKLDDLSLPGRLIDAALAAGATNVNGIVFTLRDQSAVRREALAQAAVKAREDADAIARALNLHVTGVLDATTEQTPLVLRPLPMMSRAMQAKTEPTPIDPGTLDVHATVTLTVLVQ